MTYIAYKNDRPLFVSDSRKEMASFLGITANAVSCKVLYYRRNKQKRPYSNEIQLYAYDFKGGIGK